tara:strand:+ start:1086 stop:1616 length:531 start_codon:yes stop_codon:yes gene_type:complete
MKWYSLRVISGKEKSTKDNILFEADSQNMSEFIDNIFVPFEKVIELRNNKKKVKEKLFFPGYILINMDLNKETRYMIENINGVLSFVGPKGGNPVPLRDDEIKRIFGEVEDKDGREIIEVSFLKGDNVKIISGPFVDFNGVVEEINEDKQKVKVIVSIFGRPTPVELDFFQVEMYK